MLNQATFGPAQICNVTNAGGTMGATDVTVTCGTPYSVGGNVLGLNGTGLELQNNTGDNLQIDSNGAFTFDTDLIDRSDYEVTIFIQPSGPEQECHVSSGSGMVDGEDVTDVLVDCRVEEYFIDGFEAPPD